MGKVIQRELCKKLKFDDLNKWYIHSPESFLENEPHKVIWGFEIQTDPHNKRIQQTSRKKVKDKAQLAEKKRDPFGIVEEVKFWSCWQLVYAQTRISPKNEP